jgi:hypothetical protein
MSRLGRASRRFWYLAGVPANLPRRRVLLASATLPLLLAAAGCRSSDVFAGPDPLAGRPRLGHDVVTLQAVIAAEEDLVDLYQSAVGGDSRTIGGLRALEPLLAQHERHLAWLRARLIVPPGTPASAPARPSPLPSRVPAATTIAGLRAAEQASAASLVRRLATVEPALAQLFASIAASDATHAAVLSGLGS